MINFAVLSVVALSSVQAIQLDVVSDMDRNNDHFRPWWEVAGVDPGQADSWGGGPRDTDPEGLDRWVNNATTPSDDQYFATNAYMAKSAVDKMADLWSMMEPEPGNLQTPAPILWNGIDNLFIENSNGSFCIFADEMEIYREKVTHIQGVVAKVEWEPVGDYGFTGIYAEGSDQVILRLSQTSNLTEESTGLHPSMALKFLYDGILSTNIVAMQRSFAPTDSWDFFSEPMSSRVDPFEDGSIIAETLGKKLIEGSPQPFVTGIGEMARFSMNGSELTEEDSHTPYELEFRSTVNFSDDPEIDDYGNQVTFYEQLRRIEAGSTLFEVYGMTAPHELGGEYVHIANVNMITSPITSLFGDQRLHFNHRRLGNDLRIWPQEWRRYQDEGFDQLDQANRWGNTVPTGENGWPEDMDEAREKYADQVATYGCPFAWLLGMN